MSLAGAIDFAIGRDRVEVPLDQRHVACSRHGEPFRAEWPRGWPEFALAVSTRALGSPALQAGLESPAYWWMTELLWEDLPRRRTPEQIREVLAGRPACEWLSREQLFECYRESGIGVIGLCQLCRIFRIGTPYHVREHGQARRIAHVCFHDLVAGVPIR